MPGFQGRCLPEFNGPVFFNGFIINLAKQKLFYG